MRGTKCLCNFRGVSRKRNSKRFGFSYQRGIGVGTYRLGMDERVKQIIAHIAAPESSVGIESKHQFVVIH